MSTIDYAELEHLAEEQDDDSDLVRTLRRQIKATTKHARDRDDLASENQKLKLDGIVRDADLGALNEHQRETLADWAAKQSDVSPEALHERAVALGWAEAKPDPAAQEIETHGQIATAAAGASPKGGHEITPQDAAGWDPQKRREFLKQHPDAYKRLQAGETVAGVTF